MGNSYKVRDVCIAAHGRAVEAIGSVAPNLPTGMTLALQALECGPGGEALYQRLFEGARRPFYEACVNDDFIGIQPYNRFRTGPSGYYEARPGGEIDAWGHEADEQVLEAALREAWEHCRIPMLVSEHGINSQDDTQRLRHLRGSLDGLRNCVADGLEVLGYVHWSLLDNFEWRSGYGPRFGLYEVNRTTFARSPKPSAEAFRSLVAEARRSRDD
jgi:beta-glucosidase